MLDHRLSILELGAIKTETIIAVKAQRAMHHLPRLISQNFSPL